MAARGRWFLCRCARGNTACTVIGIKQDISVIVCILCEIAVIKFPGVLFLIRHGISAVGGGNAQIKTVLVLIDTVGLLEIMLRAVCVHVNKVGSAANGFADDTLLNGCFPALSNVHGITLCMDRAGGATGFAIGGIVNQAQGEGGHFTRRRSEGILHGQTQREIVHISGSGSADRLRMVTVDVLYTNHILIVDNQGRAMSGLRIFIAAVGRAGVAAESGTGVHYQKSGYCGGAGIP